MNTIIYGATDTGKGIYEDIKHKTNVIGFVDDDSRKWGEYINNLKINNPETLKTTEFDEIIIGVLTYQKEVFDKLISFNIPFEKINQDYVKTPALARIECLKSIKILIEEGNISGNVAEVGVFRGEFAKEINRIFPNKKLYLFDTFEGFSKHDIEKEIQKNYMSEDKTGYFSNTNEKLVMSLMKYPENCIIKKGFFPQTAEDVEDVFCFVNLDADLYAPTLAGLNFFWDKMSKGGIILIHDYFSKAFHGVKDALKEFCDEKNITFVPIGDTLSVAIRKF